MNAKLFCAWLAGTVANSMKQFMALGRKNLILSLRGWKMSCCVLITPFFVVMMLAVVMGAITSAMKLPSYKSERYPAKTQVSTTIPRCQSPNGNCKTIAFVNPKEGGLFSQVIQKVLEFNGFTSDDARVFKSDTELNDFLLKNPNQTAVAVSFQPNEKNIQYTLMYNATVTQGVDMISREMPNYLPSLQLSVDSAIATLLARNPIVKAASDKLASTFNVNLKPYPIYFSNSSSALEAQLNQVVDAITFFMFGAYFVQFALVAFWIVILYYMSYEKTNMLKFGLTVMGVDNETYWSSWYIHGFFMIFVSTLITIITGLVMDIPFFTKTNFVVLFVVFGSFGFSLLTFAVIVTVITTSVKAAVIVAFVINGIAFTFGSFTSSGIFVYLAYLFLNDFLVMFVALFPPFSFAKCVADIAIKTYILGVPYTFKDFFVSPKRFHQYAAILLSTAKVPSTFGSCMYIIVASMFYMIVAWYVDNVFPGKFGSAKPFYFFILPSYWKLKATSLQDVNTSLAKYSSTIEQAKHDEMQTNPGVDSEVIKEMEAAIRPSDSNHAPENAILRIIQLQKTYTSLFSGNVHALKGVSITASKGSCLGILGHNGAGKTTLIGTLIGLNQSSQGTAYIFGRNVQTDMGEIQKLVGVCPQHDILWDDLTAWETMQLYANVKDVPLLKQKEHITQLLKDVELYDVRKKRVGTFSGGMKRRMSVAVSMIGGSQIIFLDEPTTGLDPKSRRAIWQLIHKLKRDKLVVLTTHSMEEADRLADKIAIMAFGKIKCLGNSLRLKSQFGGGYSLTLVTAQEKVNQVKQLVAQQLGQVQLISSTAGSLLYSLPKVPEERLIPFVQTLEQNTKKTQDESNMLLENWALQMSSLEEVFLSVTQKANFGYNSEQMVSH